MVAIENRTITTVLQTNCSNDDFTGTRDAIKKGNYYTKDTHNLEVPTEKYRCILGEFETPLYWGNLIGITMLHVLTLYAMLRYRFDRYDILYGVLIGGIGGFGVTAGAHRYLTHRCFKATLPLKIVLLMFYSVAGQNTLVDWVRDHRVHHKFSESDADPHNANRGFFFAHVGWLCMRKHPEVFRKGKTVDISDITSDPILQFHTRHWTLIKLLFCFIIPTVIPPYFFGRSWVITFWLNIIRYTFNLNFTWSVNSFAHIWGNKPYNKNIQPVENKFVALVAMGEGWHNYHHSFPWDYRAAEMGTPLNITTFWLNVFAKIGWAYDLRTTGPELIESLVSAKGDGSHKKRQ